jgi:hypothetical protein
MVAILHMARLSMYKPEFREQLTAFFDVEPFSDVPTYRVVQPVREQWRRWRQND